MRGWRRDLSVSHNKIGDVLVAQGDLPGALVEFRAGMAIRKALADADAGNAGWRRDLPSREDFAALLDESFGQNECLRRLRRQGQGRRHREGRRRHRRRSEDRRPRGAEGIHRPRPGRRSRSATRSRSISSASRTRWARPSSRATRRAARRAGSSSKRRSTPRKRSKASSSIRSRAASPSISTAPWPSCRVRRSTSVRSATSAR
jgi:hypothetical protein